MVDGDTVFEPDTVRRARAAAADPRVGAVVRQHQGRQPARTARPLAAHRVRHRLQPRPPVFDVPQCMPTVPGAIGAFRREALVDAGGVSRRHAGRGHRPDDGHLSRRLAGGLRRTGPGLDRGSRHVRQLWRQRYRWCYGTMQAMWKHRQSVRAGASGKLGRRGLPYLLVFQVLLPLLAPAIDIATLYGPHLRLVVADSWWDWRSWRCSSSPPRTPSGWTANRSGRCGRCPSSNLSTGNSCISWWSSPYPAPCTGCGCGGRPSGVRATWRPAVEAGV